MGLPPKRHRRISALVRAGTLATGAAAAVGSLTAAPAQAATGTVVVTADGEVSSLTYVGSGECRNLDAFSSADVTVVNLTDKTLRLHGAEAESANPCREDTLLTVAPGRTGDRDGDTGDSSLDLYLEVPTGL